MTSNCLWPERIDEVIGGDQAVAVGYVTPARGVVLLPLANTGVRDARAGTIVAFTSSIGMWRKLERIQREPRIAVAYHTRAHGFSGRPEYVLAQGRASIAPLSDRDWIECHRDSWERFSGPRDVGFWEPLLRAYHWRVAVTLDVERVVVWPDLGCRGVPAVLGTPIPADPQHQRKPIRGTAPRIDPRRAGRRAARLPHVLLAWVDGDGFPEIVPVRITGSDERGILLAAAPGTVPPGGRRAGLLAHSFARFTFGQHQSRHSGWLEHEGDRLRYAPHTESGYRLPESRLAYRTAAAVVTRRGLRAARRAGIVPRR